MRLRNAERADLEAITEIYNREVLTATSTFDTKPKQLPEQADWFEKHTGRHPVVVAVEGRQIVGWASLSAWSDRPAYDDTAELSIYVREGFRGRGIGKVLAVELMDRARASGLHTLIARISETGAASIALLQRLGFSTIGIMKEAGNKFGKLLDVHLMQIVFDGADRPVREGFPEAGKPAGRAGGNTKAAGGKGRPSGAEGKAGAGQPLERDTVFVDPEKCTGCGLCVEICHEHCIGLVGRTATIDYALCSTCTQCIAVCPEGALSWNGIPPLPFDTGLLPSVEQFDELLMERRTARSFTEKRIDRETLEKLVGYAMFAPTHSFDLRAIIVDDPEIIRLADRAIFGFVKRLYSLVYKPAPISALLRLMPVALRSEYFRAKPKLEAGLHIGRAFRSSPAALVLLVGDRRVPLSVESAQYALYNIALAAQVRAIGARNLVGNQMILSRNKAFRRRLSLLAHERIFGTLGLGYPSVRFRNKVAGRKLDTSWNDG